MRPRILLTVTALLAAVLAGGDAAAQRQRWPGDGDQGDAQSTGRTAAPRNDPPPQAAPAPPPPPPPPVTTRSAPAAEADGRAQRRAEPRQGSRDRGDNPQSGVAVPRRGPAPRPGDRDRDVYVVSPRGYNPYYYYPRRYYPYGYGAFGLGYFYYDPYAWSPYDYDPYYRFGGYGYGYPTGELRLIVKPREAEVYVDGYYAGQVDDFDGILQSLRLEEGPYSIEVVAPGYEPLEFDVRVQPGRKITYRGELLPARP